MVKLGFKNGASMVIELKIRVMCTSMFKVYGSGKGREIKVERCTFLLHVSCWLISLYYAMRNRLVDDTYQYVWFVLILLLLCILA